MSLRLAVLALALAHAGAAYAAALPAIRERRDNLLRGAALFAWHEVCAGLEYPEKFRAGRLLKYMQAHDYYHLPQADDLVSTDDVVVDRLTVAPVPFSIHGYQGERLLDRVGGSLTVHVQEHGLRLTGWMDIPTGREGMIYVGAPVPPTAFSVNDAQAEDVGQAPPPERQDRPGRGFVLDLEFPPDTDLAALTDDMCVAYESLDIPRTLFVGNLPLCAERLLVAVDVGAKIVGTCGATVAPTM